MSRFDGQWQVAFARAPFPDLCGGCGETFIVPRGPCAVTLAGEPLCDCCVDRSDYDLAAFLGGRR